MSYADSLLATGRADRPSRAPALVRLRLGRALGDPRAHPRGRRSAVLGGWLDGGSGIVWTILSWVIARGLFVVGIAVVPLDDPPLPEPGVRDHEPARHPGRGRGQQDVDRQLAREDQRRRADQSLFGRMFGFGDLDVLTASERASSDFDAARRRSSSRRRCSRPSTSSRSRSRPARDAAAARTDAAASPPRAAAAAAGRRRRPHRRAPARGQPPTRPTDRRPTPDEVAADRSRASPTCATAALITPEEYEAQEGGAARAGSERRRARYDTRDPDPQHESPRGLTDQHPRADPRRDLPARRLPGPRVLPRLARLPARRRDRQAVRPADAQPDRPFRPARRRSCRDLAARSAGSCSAGRSRRRSTREPARPAQRRGDRRARRAGVEPR